MFQTGDVVEVGTLRYRAKVLALPFLSATGEEWVALNWLDPTGIMSLDDEPFIRKTRTLNLTSRSDGSLPVPKES